MNHLFPRPARRPPDMHYASAESSLGQEEQTRQEYAALVFFLSLRRRVVLVYLCYFYLNLNINRNIPLMLAER